MLCRMFLSLSLLLALGGCAGPLNQGYAEASVTYEYGPADRDASEWRAQLTALDTCHREGYVDLLPKAPPRSECLKEGPAQACLRTRATAVYDCYGLGYQTNG